MFYSLEVGANNVFQGDKKVLGTWFDLFSIMGGFFVCTVCRAFCLWDKESSYVFHSCQGTRYDYKYSEGAPSGFHCNIFSERSANYF